MELAVGGRAGEQVYATSMAMLVTMVVSVAAFGLAPTLQLGLGIATASISLVLYYLPPAALIAAEPPDGSGKLPTTRARLPA